MTEQDMPAKRRRRCSASVQTPPPRWPGDPAHGDGIDVDVEAIAHVLANTCRWGGRTQRFLSLAQHALTMSEEIEALDGVGDEDRRALALHALLVPARTAWLGDEEGEHPATTWAAARAKTLGAAIDRAVREAAGLDPELPEDWSEVLRFVARMTDAAEQGNTLVRRDLGVGRRQDAFPAAAAHHPAAWRLRRRQSAGSPVSRELAGSSAADAADVHTGGGAAGIPGRCRSRRRPHDDRGGRRHGARAPGCYPGLPHVVQVRLVDRHRRHPRGPGCCYLEDHQRLHQP